MPAKNPTPAERAFEQPVIRAIEQAVKRAIEQADTAEYESLQRASTRTALSVWLLREKIASGELPAYRASDKPGSAIRVKIADVDALMKPVLPAEMSYVNRRGGKGGAA
jgi:hypothetical protein